MGDKFNFSTQFNPHFNKLKKWVNNIFYPYIKRMSQRTNTFWIYTLSSHNDELMISKNNAKNISFVDLVKELNHFNKKAGLYGVRISCNNQTAFIYVGKSKNLSNRAIQHLTGKNLNGEPIAESTKHKHSEIYDLVSRNDIEVSFFIWTNKGLTKSLNNDYELVILEALFIAKSKSDFLELNDNQKLSFTHWNLRVG